MREFCVKIFFAKKNYLAAKDYKEEESFFCCGSQIHELVECAQEKGSTADNSQKSTKAQWMLINLSCAMWI